MDQPPIAGNEATRDAGVRSGVLSRPLRWMFAMLGVVSVGLAVIGAVLPGLPTTIFLIVASYCFTRSCPWLEERLLGHRIFAPYVPYIRPGAPMPRRARVIAIAAMWVSIAISLVGIQRAGWLSPVVAAGLVGSGVIGTIAIVLVRRDGRPLRSPVASDGRRCGPAAGARPTGSDRLRTGSPQSPRQSAGP